MERLWVAAQATAAAFLAEEEREERRAAAVAEAMFGAVAEEGYVVAGGRVCVVSYEGLLREPERVLGAICAMAGVAFEAEMTNPYESADAVASFASAQMMAMADPKLLRRKALNAAQADKWREVRLPRPLTEEARSAAVRLGYELLAEGDEARSL